ncbi:MAG: DUF177 domain-containing protein [Methylocella sp.]
MKLKRGPGAGNSRMGDNEKAALPTEAGHFSRFVAVADVPDTGLKVSISADAEERAAIAQSDGLVAVESLSADLLIARQNRTQFKVSGPLRARIVQTCIVSLDPFESDLEAEVEAEFIAPPENPSRKRAGRDAEMEANVARPVAAPLDALDPIIDGRIDVGALVEEFFALNLDHYPRKPGVRFDEASFSKPAAEASPFTVLKKLKDGD